jgi:hypothetical protein
VRVRPRVNDDLPALGRLAEAVYRMDGYPRYRPADLVQDGGRSAFEWSRTGRILRG